MLGTKWRWSRQAHTGNLTRSYRNLQLFSNQQRTPVSLTTKSIHAMSGLPCSLIQICGLAVDISHFSNEVNEIHLPFPSSMRPDTPEDGPSYL